MVTCVNRVCKATGKCFRFSFEILADFDILVCLPGLAIAANGFCVQVGVPICSTGYVLDTLTNTCGVPASTTVGAISCRVGYTFSSVFGYCVDTGNDPNNWYVSLSSRF